MFFTGSTFVGQIIAQKCSEKLIPYTLELGGKSPVVIDESCQFQATIENIFWGKFLNRGQTCVAPDYVMIPHHLKDQFIKSFNQLNYEIKEKPTGIINDKFKKRLFELSSGAFDLEKHLALALDADLEVNQKLMSEEIFTPLLAVKGYDD